MRLPFDGSRLSDDERSQVECYGHTFWIQTKGQRCVGTLLNDFSSALAECEMVNHCDGIMYFDIKRVTRTEAGDYEVTVWDVCVSDGKSTYKLQK